MRFPFVFSFLIAAASLTAQVSTDTVFWNSGAPQQVLYYHSVKPGELSRAQMFQRGIRPGDEARIRDSVHLYDEAGVFLRTMSRDERTTPRSTALRAHQKKQDKDLLEFTPSSRHLEGRAGMVTRKKVRLPAGKKFSELRRLDNYPGIEILQTPADTNGMFTVKVRLPAGAATPKLRLDVGEETDWEKPFSLRGYHLNETDFKARTKLTDEQTWRAEGRDHLYLRLRSTEKLMHIYRDDELYTVVPVGRQLDEVRVAGLPVGKYLLEIIDLGTQAKRYYWLVTGR